MAEWKETLAETRDSDRYVLLTLSKVTTSVLTTETFGIKQDVLGLDYRVLLDMKEVQHTRTA